VDLLSAGRTQKITYNGELSSIQSLLFSVPQSRFLGLLLMLKHTAELFNVIAQHQLRLHMYPDVNQVYVTTPANNATAAVAHLSAAIADISDWMKAS